MEQKQVTIEEALKTGAKCNVFRKNSVYASAWFNGKLHFVFRDQTRVVFNPSLTSQTVRAEAERNGWHQRLVDKMAMGTDDEGGNKQAQMAAKIEDLRALVAHLESGTDQWEMTRASNGGALSEGLVARAMVRAGLIKEEAAAEPIFVTLAGKRNVEKSAIVKLFSQDPKVATAIVEIRTEEAMKRVGSMTVSASDLLAEMGKA